MKEGDKIKSNKTSLFEIFVKLSIETGRENPILRSRSTEITALEWKKLAPLGRSMLDWLKAKDNGAGLAAPQVGTNKRLIAVNIYREDDDDFEIIRSILMVNPVIRAHSSEEEDGEEGCFSVPNEFGFVRRFSGIIVDFYDENYKKKSLNLSHFSARVVQHEIDHLDGILFTDKLLSQSS